MKKLCIILFASFVAGTFIGDFFQQKNVQPKNTLHCPSGFIEWNKTWYLPIDRIDKNGDSIKIVEKHFFEGCYPFMNENSNNSAYVDTIYETIITGIFNQRTLQWIAADTIRTIRTKKEYNQN